MMQDGKTRTRETIKKRVKDATAGKWVGAGRAKYAGFGDPKFYLPTKQEAESFLGSQEYPGFQDNSFDCEDFAFVCKAYVANFQQAPGNVDGDFGLCIGIAWGRFSWIGGGAVDHACNWVLFDTGKFEWYEPQTNEFYPPSAATAKRLRLVLV